MTRKYENGFEIINTKGLTLFGYDDVTKIRIYRKAITRKTDTCIRYECDIYRSSWTMPTLRYVSELEIDEILSNLNR